MTDDQWQWLFLVSAPIVGYISRDGRYSYRVPGHVVARMTGKNRILGL